MSRRHHEDKDLEADRIWFERHVGQELAKLDADSEPSPVRLQDLERFVAEHKRHVKARLRKELAALWLIAVILFCGMQWVVERSWIWFAAFQSAAAFGGIMGAAAFYAKGLRAWKKR